MREKGAVVTYNPKFKCLHSAMQLTLVCGTATCIVKINELANVRIPL